MEKFRNIKKLNIKARLQKPEFVLIGFIFASVVSFIFKERMSKREYAVLSLGIISIFLLNL